MIQQQQFNSAPQQNQFLSGPAPTMNGFNSSSGQGPPRNNPLDSVSLPSNGTVEMPYVAPKVGLQNTNNTCYMNSFIQSLFQTNHFLWRIFSFHLELKKNPSKVDKEDFEFGKKVVKLLQHHMAKMEMTKYKHCDIADILNAFPPEYRSGEQQDVTETIRFVFDKLGSFDQPLIREVFAGELSEKTQCKACGNVKSRPETFTDLVLPVPTENEVLQTRVVPTTQALLAARLKFEALDADCLVHCDTCQTKQQAGKWCELVSPPAQLVICLNRFTFNMEKMDFTKEKTPVRVDLPLVIGPCEYRLYMVIVHTGKDASSGHYYAIGKRSEVTADGDENWYTMDDSQIKLADLSILAGTPSEKMKDDNPYVLFYRCAQAPPTPPLRIPQPVADEVKREDDKRVES